MSLFLHRSRIETKQVGHTSAFGITKIVHESFESKALIEVLERELKNNLKIDFQLKILSLEILAFELQSPEGKLINGLANELITWRYFERRKTNSHRLHGQLHY